MQDATNPTAPNASDTSTSEARKSDTLPPEKPATETPPTETSPMETPPTETHKRDVRPFILVTVLLDAGARPAAVTRSHGDAMERAYIASSAEKTAGLDLVELPITPAAFAALRKALGLPDAVVGLYDVFPLAAHLSPAVRRVAGQFLAAEAVWTLEEQGQLGGVPLNARLDLPKGWSNNPKEVHQKLVGAGALDLSADAIDAFKRIKSAWDASSS